uniref:Uncharacterized protein n=1 Tax=Opuntia streptacantha TaxID=393608 RepID=A0A7C8YS70_OPUST
MLKYLNSYTLRSLLEAMTRSQSLTLCFFKYFFVKYFKYLLEKLESEVTMILFLSRVMVTESPRLPALPPTLILSWRNFSREAISMILSSTGFEQSIVKVAPFFLPFGPPAAAPLLIFTLLPENQSVKRGQWW